MSHTLALLNEMRGRLPMYIGFPSVTRLAAYLRGYDHAVGRQGLGKADPFLIEFRDWIHTRYQTAAESWEDTIRNRSADEAEALKKFWELFDEFIATGKGKHSIPEVPLTTPREQFR